MAIAWMPMVEGDDRDAALANVGAYDDPRVVHGWDPERLLGRTWSAGFAARHADLLADAARAMPELAARIAQLSADVAEAPPAWDVAFFFERGVEWGPTLPEPRAWTKQFDFWSDADGTHGAFLSDVAPRARTESAWRHEFARGAEAVLAR